VAVPLAELDEVRGELHGLLGLATVVALAVAAVLSALATHLGSGRIRTVTAVARRLASGDLAARTRLAGRDEISELGRTLDQLAEGLDNSLGRLREERDLLAGILQGMDEGVLLLDREGMIGIINPALRDMLCLGGEATGRPLLDVIRAAELKMLIDRVREGGESQHAELDLPGLRPRRARVRVSPLRQDPARLVLVFLDVTEVRRLESVRRDFVANVSHELRTPVAAVRSAAETLAEALDRDPVAAREFVAMIDRNAERLQRLVEDLLDLSRIEAPEYRMRSETLELKHALAAVLEPFAARAAENGLALSVELPADLRVTADRRGLEQVVGNLLDNGVKYCPRGAALSVTAVEHQGRVRIAVTDTGPGIEALHLPRLFERFYRVDKGRSREQGGTGLGLSIVKRLVEAMGGEVGVESMPGRGSTFWFTLPRA
jgi:two-component system phosphate regulon sensor histidine kinase PhoR